MAKNKPPDLDVGAALTRVPIYGSNVEDRTLIDTSVPHVWGPEDFPDPDAPVAETPMGVAAGMRDIRRPTADEVMRYILENASTSDEPMTNSVVRKRK